MVRVLSCLLTSDATPWNHAATRIDETLSTRSREHRAQLTLASRRRFCRRRKSLVLVRTHSRKAHVLLSPFLLSLFLFIVKLDKLTPAAMREDYCDLAQNIERSHASCIRYRHNGEFLAKVRGVAKRPDRFTRFSINPPRQLPPAYIVASNSRHVSRYVARLIYDERFGYSNIETSNLPQLARCNTTKSSSVLHLRIQLNWECCFNRQRRVYIAQTYFHYIRHVKIFSLFILLIHLRFMWYICYTSAFSFKIQ